MLTLQPLQLDLLADLNEVVIALPRAQGHHAIEAKPSLDDYEEFIVFFSGGKDSVACVLHLLEQGVPANKIELHHHLVDGREGSTLMDWPVTDAYCEAFAKAFGMKYVTSWRVGGFEREMLRQNASTAPVAVPMPDGSHIVMGGERSPPNTRMRFPQVTASLQQRWCSSSVKIEVADRYLCNNPRFADGKKRLIVTGARAEESAARANYAGFEPHRKDNRAGARVKRWLDHWRPVHAWTEQQVWEIIERHAVVPHPVYDLGLSRASCAFCIFGGPSQWATLRAIDPVRFGVIAGHERTFGVTIHRDRSVIQQADRGEVLALPDSPQAKAVLATTWEGPIVLQPGEWRLPRGAYGKSGGPT